MLVEQYGSVGGMASTGMSFLGVSDGSGRRALGGIGAELLRRLAGDGLAVCLVEHDVGLVMQVCSTITVLDYGAVIARGTPEQIRVDPAVIDAYLGTPEGLGPTEGVA